MSTKLTSKRFWAIAVAVIVAAILFRQTLGTVLLALIFWSLVLAALFVLPAIIGAVAGSTVGDVVRWVKRWQHRRWRKSYDKSAA